MTKSMTIIEENGLPQTLAPAKIKRQRLEEREINGVGLDEMELTDHVTEPVQVGSFKRIEAQKTAPRRSGGRRKMNQISKLQKDIYEFLDQFIEEHNGLPPTVREIQEKLSISSTSVVDYNLKALESKGYISRNKKQSRGVVLLSRAKTVRAATVPLMGVIAAGQPIPDRADLTPDDVVEVPSYMFKGRPGPDVFALRVKGQSMIDALIDDGDIVLIKPQENAERGETVAVWLESEGETTLKKWYPEPEHNRVRLQPANTTMQPIYTELDNARIMGKLVGVIRTVA